jgi:putative oxidoreductase
MKIADFVFASNGDSRSVASAGFVLRVALGTMWISHALLKVMVFTLPGAAKFFDSVGLPGFLVYPVVAAELIGGTAILLGYRTRAVSILLLPILLVATWVHSKNGWVFTATGGGWEYPAFLAVASVVQALIGNGVLALKPAGSRIAAHVSAEKRSLLTQ